MWNIVTMQLLYELDIQIWSTSGRYFPLKALYKAGSEISWTEIQTKVQRHSLLAAESIIKLLKYLIKIIPLTIMYEHLSAFNTVKVKHV